MSTTSTSVKNHKRTKQFKGLVAVLGDEATAIIAWNRTYPDRPILVSVPDVKDEITEDEQRLMDSGFNLEQARAALVAASQVDTTAAPEPEEPLSSHEQGEVLAAKAGLVPVRGRVYAHAALIEAQARVLKTGKPELVQHPGEHRTKAVLVYRMDDKVVALQNYGVQN